MVSIKRNERGFSAVESGLVIIIVVAISVVGWYVYKHRSPSTTNPVSTTTSQPSTSASAPLSSGTSNSALQSDLSNISNSNAQSNQDMNATNNSLNDQSTMTSVPQ